MLQKDITCYVKYREFSGIFTINDHISDNVIQINIKFTFTVYEYIIKHEYILLSNFLYIYIYIIYIDCQDTLLKTCLSCRKSSVKMKYFLTVHYFVVIMFTFL